MIRFWGSPGTIQTHPNLHSPFRVGQTTVIPKTGLTPMRGYKINLGVFDLSHFDLPSGPIEVNRCLAAKITPR